MKTVGARKEKEVRSSRFFFRTIICRRFVIDRLMIDIDTLTRLLRFLP